LGEVGQTGGSKYQVHADSTEGYDQSVEDSVEKKLNDAFRRSRLDFANPGIAAL
jgi:hypothetical protein